MRKNRNKILAAGAMLAVIFISCNTSIWYSGNYKIANGNWSMYDPAKYECTINDTARTFDIEFSIRTTSDYPYRNIYMFVSTLFPSGTTVTDTLQVMITEKGKWLGKGAGDIHELIIPYKSNVYFPETGEYHFIVTHGMRDTILKGVNDLGIKISIRDNRVK